MISQVHNVYEQSINDMKASDESEVSPSIDQNSGSAQGKQFHTQTKASTS